MISIRYDRVTVKDVRTGNYFLGRVAVGSFSLIFRFFDPVVEFHQVNSKPDLMRHEKVGGNNFKANVNYFMYII